MIPFTLLGVKLTDRAQIVSELHVFVYFLAKLGIEIVS